MFFETSWRHLPSIAVSAALLIAAERHRSLQSRRAYCNQNL
jgi:hypothetical protein